MVAKVRYILDIDYLAFYHLLTAFTYMVYMNNNEGGAGGSPISQLIMFLLLDFEIFSTSWKRKRHCD